jgi:chaperonin cofactor prefoldin
VEAAQIPWRPLGRLLVEQGLLTDDELELALAKQEQTGKRLGETILECGFVSRPDLSNALASQYGIDLQTESGFGTGLRSQIQRRHESERGRGFRPALVVVSNPTEPAAVENQESVELEPDEEREALLLAQLEEQWAKLAAAEARLADRERELSDVGRADGRRRAQVARFVGRIRVRDERLRQSVAELDELTEVAEKLLARVEELSSQVRSRDERIERLTHDVRGCDEEIERLRAQVAPAPEPSVGHLVLVQLGDRYELVERAGSPPGCGATLELPELCEGILVVAGSGRSPLPGDARPCAFVQRGRALA